MNSYPPYKAISGRLSPITMLYISLSFLLEQICMKTYQSLPRIILWFTIKQGERNTYFCYSKFNTRTYQKEINKIIT